MAYCVGAGLSTERRRDRDTDDGNEQEERKNAAAIHHASERCSRCAFALCQPQIP
jgi:hypothetical protein